MLVLSCSLTSYLNKTYNCLGASQGFVFTYYFVGWLFMCFAMLRELFKSVMSNTSKTGVIKNNRWM